MDNELFTSKNMFGRSDVQKRYFCKQVCAARKRCCEDEDDDLVASNAFLDLELGNVASTFGVFALLKPYDMIDEGRKETN